MKEDKFIQKRNMIARVCRCNRRVYFQPFARKVENVMPHSAKNVKKITKAGAREKLQVVGVVVPLNAGPSSHKIHERDGLGARGVTISHNYRLATLTIRPTPVGSNRRQLSCISIRRGPTEY